MSQRSLWLAAYDIAEPRRLRAVAKICEDVGRRIQQSVFLCHTPRPHRHKFRADIDAVINPAEDRVVVVPICKRCRRAIEQHGPSFRLPEEHATVIV